MRTEPDNEATISAIAVADAAGRWRRAEIHYAMIEIGESKGNKTLAALAVIRQLRQLRISSDRYQAAVRTHRKANQ